MGRAANPHILQGVYQVMDLERYISVCSGVIKPGQSDANQQSAKISTSSSRRATSSRWSHICNVLLSEVPLY